MENLTQIIEVLSNAIDQLKALQSKPKQTLTMITSENWREHRDTEVWCWDKDKQNAILSTLIYFAEASTFQVKTYDIANGSISHKFASLEDPREV